MMASGVNEFAADYKLQQLGHAWLSEPFSHRSHRALTTTAPRQFESPKLRIIDFETFTTWCTLVPFSHDLRRSLFVQSFESELCLSLVCCDLLDDVRHKNNAHHWSFLIYPLILDISH